ncbi:hypothetical protein CAL7102_00162 [Dulcicalothrix desertica PCC 7102]|nr:hypothetical protein CAL7102_00162 [Dulcicalothrix desertica PCC 7102]
MSQATLDILVEVTDFPELSYDEQQERERLLISCTYRINP